MKIKLTMQPADLTRSKRDNVVDVVRNSGRFRQENGVCVKLPNLFPICPFRSCLYFRRLSGSVLCSTFLGIVFRPFSCSGPACFYVCIIEREVLFFYFLPIIEGVGLFIGAYFFEILDSVLTLSRFDPFRIFHSVLSVCGLLSFGVGRSPSPRFKAGGLCIFPSVS